MASHASYRLDVIEGDNRRSLRVYPPDIAGQVVMRGVHGADCDTSVVLPANHALLVSDMLRVEASGVRCEGITSRYSLKVRTAHAGDSVRIFGTDIGDIYLVLSTEDSGVFSITFDADTAEEIAAALTP